MKKRANRSPLFAHYTKEDAVAEATKLRSQLVESVAQTGGHLSSNLGTVELSVAIHRVFDTSYDRLVFDVGHQCYCHKLITQRDFQKLRQYGGVSGFPKPSESIHDAFIAGHASNSVAVAVGMAEARALLDEEYHVIALLGDGALTGGLAYEGLASAGAFQGQLLVILNDNGMSITKNVGGMAKYLSTQRLKPQYLQFRALYRKVLDKTPLGKKLHRFNHNVKQAIKTSLLPCSLFEQMGFTYYGPIDAHDVEEVTRILDYAKGQSSPVLLHLRSTKGKGYRPAEAQPDKYHGVAPFVPETGILLNNNKPAVCSFSQAFGETLTELGQTVPQLCCITAAMSTGTGLDIFAKAFPHRLYDVGIAEGCATALAGGLAKQGALPVFAVYSTFLQRAYDMILHDVALLNLPVVFGVDRAGLVGEDGETHHGVFDLAFLSTVPNLRIFAPSSLAELRDMVKLAVTQASGSVAIRYPRGTEGQYSSGYSGFPVEILEEGKHITLLSYGMTMNAVLSCGERLKKEGYHPEILKINQLAPLDDALILQSVAKTGRLVCVEEVIASACVGEKISASLAKEGITAKICLINCGCNFIPQGSLAELQKSLSLDEEGIFKQSMEVLSCGEAEKGTS